jgi:uncharacterized protein YdiU (UPF0061 family)
MGRFQFLDAFVPGHICNHSDHQGRYAYNRQPNIAYWNLFCLGQALLPLIGDQDTAMAALESYKTLFRPTPSWRRCAAKLGLTQAQDSSEALMDHCCTCWLATPWTTPSSGAACRMPWPGAV